MRLHHTLVLSLACSEFSIEDTDRQVTTPMTVEESFLHRTEPSVDVLLVIDDTASMRSEHLMLSEALPVLIETLQQAEISWQIGAITTDIMSPSAAILTGDPWVITSSTDEPLLHLQTMIDVGTLGSQPEAGFASALMALTPPLVDGANRGLRRPNAALHVVVISDGDDNSEQILDTDPTEAFLAFLSEQSATSGEPSRLSALVGPSPNGCTGISGTALPGSKYLEVALESEGYIDSICDIDFEEMGNWIATTSQPENPRFLLQASPRPTSIRVQVNDSRWDSGWTLLPDIPAIQFTNTPPAGAEIRVRYEVKSS